ncbi:MAG: hypothetical protein RIS29_2437 [Bacteroidota bacterium]|jgi:hypothetical protein
MDDKTIAMIEKLAQKIGTTSDYVFEVLVRQAPIEATVTLFQCVFIFILSIVWYVTHKKLSSIVPDCKYKYSYYEKYDMGAVVPMVVSGVILIFFLIAAFFCIDDIVYGYCSPEYWAIREIKNLLSQP